MPSGDQTAAAVTRPPEETRDGLPRARSVIQTSTTLVLGSTSDAARRAHRETAGNPCTRLPACQGSRAGFPCDQSTSGDRSGRGGVAYAMVPVREADTALMMRCCGQRVRRRRTVGLGTRAALRRIPGPTACLRRRTIDILAAHRRRSLGRKKKLLGLAIQRSRRTRPFDRCCQ